MSSITSDLDVAPSLLGLIGNTPMVRLARIEAKRNLTCAVVAKLETTNPGGSVKDRPALTMIEAAEAKGLLRPGGTIIEPTSGNTGVGLAVVAAQRGYECIFVMTDKVAPEKVALLRAYGAQVVVCPVAVAPDDPRSYYKTAERLLEENPGAFGPSQYHNLDNPRSHYETTGPEIWRQTKGRITHLVVGAGTGGTVSGAGRYLKEQNPAVRVVVADPEASVYAGGDGRPYLVEGIGEDFWPTTYDQTVVDEVLPVTDAQSFAMAREVTRFEGLLVGGSGGTAVFGALAVAEQLGRNDLVVVVIPDSGRGYLSKIFDDGWMAEMGFDTGVKSGEAPTVGGTVGSTVRSIGGGRAFAYVNPDSRVSRALAVMEEHGLADIPVAKGQMPIAAAQVVGSITAETLIATRGGTDRVVETVCEAPLGTVGAHERLTDVARWCVRDGRGRWMFHRPRPDSSARRAAETVVVMRDGQPVMTVPVQRLIESGGGLPAGDGGF